MICCTAFSVRGVNRSRRFCPGFLRLIYNAQILVGRLVDMGFSRPQAEEALMATGGDADLAAERLMTQVRSSQCF